MKDKKKDLLQGTLDLLVLKSLALGPLHGLGVSDRIAQITQGAFQVKPGSLFPALHHPQPFGQRHAHCVHARHHAAGELLSDQRQGADYLSRADRLGGQCGGRRKDRRAVCG